MGPIRLFRMALVSALAMAMPLAVIQPTTASTASSATTGAAPQSSSFQADPLMLADTGSGSGLSAPPAPNPYSETFTLHSDPGAPDVIYLDFVGYNGPVEPNSDPGTDTPYDLDGDPSTFSDAEMDVIQNVWARVAENFAPFDVDVTTAAPGDELFTSGDGVRVDITNGGTSALATTCGGSSDCVGEAWTGGWGELDPAAVVLPQHFGTGNAGNPEEIAEVATHEIGHTLGLEHDVTSTNSSLWGAVMDPAYQDTPLKQWTSTPAGTQSLPTGGDELAIIETTLAPKSDGYGQSFAQATPLAGVSFDVSGTITADTQTDWFSFTVPSGAGPLNLDVAPSQYSSMLDIDATLFDSSDNQLVDSDPPATFVSPSEATGLDAPFTDVSLSPGTYYLRVEGSGGPGYTSYGSIGTYTITGGFAVACAPGTYSSTGDQPCTDAPVGSYVSGTGNTSATPCPAGSYTDQTGQVGCTDAPPGSYDAGTGNTSATLCPVGTFSSNAGQSSCTDAPPGSFASGTGNTSATLCPAGTFSSVAGKAACTSAPADSYDGGTGNTSATPCPVGTTSPAGASSCSATSTTVAYDGPSQVAVSSSFAPTATLSSSSTACVPGQPVSFSLSLDPLNGSAGPYNLGSANASGAGAVTGPNVSTSGWENGTYTVTASYAGATVGAVVCPPATTTTSLAVTAASQLAFGAGTYNVAGLGASNFAFVVAKGPYGNYIGQLDIVTPGKWWFQANITSYGKTSSTQGLLGGTGALYWWDSARNKGHGAWQVAKSVVSFSATANAGNKTSAASFGVTINYAPVSPQPSPLPSSPPAALTKGGIVIS